MCLVTTEDEHFKPISIDFLGGELTHRRLYGGGKNQLLAKAMGLHKHNDLTVLDLSAGLMRDAFILACLGAQVTAIERHPEIAELIRDALERARSEKWFCDLALEFIEAEAVEYMDSLYRGNDGDISEKGNSDLPDVIYFDPMFPERFKSALAKKEMRVLKNIVGTDKDADTVFKLALTKAKKRVVIKRPRHAAYLDNQKPNFSVEGKSSRFDIYLI